MGGPKVVAETQDFTGFQCVGVAEDRKRVKGHKRRLSQ